MQFLFPTVIHQVPVQDFDQDLCITVVNALKDEEPVGVHKSNVGGWQSQFVLPKQGDYFTELIIKTLSDYFFGQKSFKKFNLNLHGYWVNINPPGASNNMHNHPGCDLAGVIWIKTNSESGSIAFRNPTGFSEGKILDLYDDEFAKQNGLYYDRHFSTPVGSCLLFPSSLDHSVSLNESNEDRISISFNLDANPI